MADQHQDIFDSLTRNAFDFLERDIAEFDKAPNTQSSTSARQSRCFSRHG